MQAGRFADEVCQERGMGAAVGERSAACGQVVAGERGRQLGQPVVATQDCG
ncbi:hypothetical protein AB0F17_45455 [Nonomuraea sp. NPDC026600]|uniref:hypothetical protein n=1 Tax=Nonomuraea sp. NPDC026600 TaxID=3155363 RepID=UPI0033E60EA9